MTSMFASVGIYTVSYVQGKVTCRTQAAGCNGKYCTTQRDPENVPINNTEQRRIYIIDEHLGLRVPGWLLRHKFSLPIPIDM